MRLLPIVLFAAASNADNFLVGVAYGVKKIRIPLPANLIIAAITFVGSVLSLLLGRYLSGYVPAGFANLLGAGVLIALGIFGLAKYFYEHMRRRTPRLLGNPEKFDRNKNSLIECKEAVSLGLALSVNNIGLGLGASVSGLPVWPAAAATFVFSFAGVLLGNFIGGGVLSRVAGKYADPLGSLGIIALGVFELR